MNSADFISLAIKLSNSRQEAELRTAVGRAYFGAFHVVRELLEICGIRFPSKELFGADVHRTIRFCLASAGNADAAAAANKLNILRQQRNFADYDLESVRFAPANTQNVKADIRLAIELLDALQRCRTEETFAQLRDELRAYAGDVLRLPVREE